MDNARVTIGDFRKKVLDKKNTVADEVFLVSEAARHYIENLAEAVTKKYNSSIKVSLSWGKQDDVIAYATDRSELHINVNNTFVTGRDDRAMKLVMMKALTLHECGHLLFTDFHLLNSNKKVFLEDRKLFPAPKCPEYDEWMTDAVVMTKPEITKWYQIWHSVQNSIEDGFIEQMILNIIPGDGKCLYSLRELQKADDISIKQQRQNGLKTPQILFNSLLTLSKYGTIKMDADDKQDPAIEELLKDYDLIFKATKEQRSYDRLKLINELFCKLYKFFKEEKKKEEEQKKKQEQDQQGQQNDSQSQSDNSSDNDDRDEDSGDHGSEDGNDSDSDNDDSVDDSSDNSGSNNSKDSRDDNSDDSDFDDDSTDSPSDDEDGDSDDYDSENNNNADEGNSQNNKNPSSDTGNDSANDNQDGKDEMDGQGIPDPFDIDTPDDSINDNINTGSGSVLNDNNIQKNDQQRQPRNNQKRLENMMSDEDSQDEAQIPTPEDKRMADAIAEQIAEEEVKEEAEKELAAELAKEAEQFDFGEFNENAELDIIRNVPSETAMNMFLSDEEAIRDDVKKLVREIKNKIKDRQNGGKINGLYQGRYLDNHSLYRFDQRVLCKNDLPEDIPNMAIALVVDASGSMSNVVKTTYARRTALLLYLFGQALNIPVMVYSHNSERKVNLTALADFGSVDGNDKYRICDYSTSGCNRDGMALRFCSEKLANRPEETKICFVISDGLPSDYRNDKEAYADIKGTLIDYSKKGVKYIACGLGSDAPHIKDIYQQGLSLNVKAEFLDCTDPSTLPVAIVRAIKELIK